MLSGDNGILQRATQSKERTEKATVIELAQTDILGQIAENKGETISETQLKTILGTYFEEFDDELPEDLSKTSITLTAKDEYGGYSNIALVDIYNGKLKKEVSLPTPTDIFVALYNDGTMVFSNNINDINSSKLQSSIANIKDIESDGYWGGPNYDFSRASVTKVNILNNIVPTSCAYWFHNCYNLTEIINIENLDTRLVTNMSDMFATCENLVADISCFDTSNVTNMEHMFANQMNDDFYGAWQVTGWQHFDVSNVTNMQRIFYDGGWRGGTATDVLDFCIRASKIPSENKKLSYTNGPSSSDVSSCENYQDFLDAGWTIGY